MLLVHGLEHVSMKEYNGNKAYRHGHFIFTAMHRGGPAGSNVVGESFHS
jgi:hypothetical protein